MSAIIIPFPVPQRPASEWKVDGEDARPISAQREALNAAIRERYQQKAEQDD